MKELEVNSPEWLLGVAVRCEDCREEDDPFLWKTLYLATRDPGEHLTVGQRDLARSTAEWHAEETGHEVVVFWMRQLNY